LVNIKINKVKLSPLVLQTQLNLWYQEGGALVEWWLAGGKPYLYYQKSIGTALA